MEAPKELFSVKVNCPIRIDFTGGFTDVAPFRDNSPVYHVNAALDSRIFVTMRKRSDARILVTSTATSPERRSVGYLNTGTPYTLITAMLKKRPLDCGIDISIYTKIPIGVGLGTSGALSIALLAGLRALRSGHARFSDVGTLAMEAATMENAIGILAGYQDQFAAAFGGLHVFRFYGRSWKMLPLKLDTSVRRDLENRLIVAYPRGAELPRSVVRDVLTAYRNGDRKVTAVLHALNQYAVKIVAVLGNGNIKDLAGLMHEVRIEQEKLHPFIIGRHTRALINEIEKDHRAGVKILGGGGTKAGILILCKNEESHLQISALLKKRTYMVLPMKIAERGIQISGVNKTYVSD